ncbi:MAG: hypothetical protein R3F61_05965 [Myxococcota bacterium]
MTSSFIGALLWISADARAVPVEWHDAVEPAVRFAVAKTGAIVTMELAPKAHLKQPRLDENGEVMVRRGRTLGIYPEMTVEVPTPARLEPEDIGPYLEAAVGRAQAHPAWDGCTTYAVTTTAYGFHVGPVRSVHPDGVCGPHASVLDRTVHPSTPGQAQVVSGIWELRDRVSKAEVVLEATAPRAFPIPAEGMTVREVLESLRSTNAAHMTWTVFSYDGDLAQVHYIGDYVPDGLPVDELPFHIEHAREQWALDQAWLEAQDSPEMRRAREASLAELLASQERSLALARAVSEEALRLTREGVDPQEASDRAVRTVKARMGITDEE